MTKQNEPTQAPAARRSRVTFGPFALIKGTLISFALFALGSLVFALTSRSADPVTGGEYSETNPLGIWFMAVAGAFAATLFVVIPLAVGLGLLLRPVARQSLHIMAFFLVFGLLAMAPFIATFERGDTGTVLLIGLIAGSLAAIGRLSVIKNVYLNTTTTPEPADAQ